MYARCRPARLPAVLGRTVAVPCSTGSTLPRAIRQDGLPAPVGGRVIAFTGGAGAAVREVGWRRGDGSTSADPRTAASYGTVGAAAHDTGGGARCRGSTKGTTNGWQAWTLTNGALWIALPAAVNAKPAVAARDGNNDLGRYRTPGNQWMSTGNRRVSAVTQGAASRWIENL